MQKNVSLEEFEQEARSFLDAHASRRPESRTLVWGEGTDSVSLFDERTPERERNELAQAREWRATTFDAGFGWITGPAAYGGRQLPNAYDRLWSSLESQYQVPHQADAEEGLVRHLVLRLQGRPQPVVRVR